LVFDENRDRVGGSNLRLTSAGA